MQAIIWLKKPIRVAGDEISILIADVLAKDDKTVVVDVGAEDHKLTAEYDSIIEGDEVQSILCIVKNSSGGYISGVADVRVIDPATL
jgi:hypothetical protein